MIIKEIFSLNNFFHKIMLDSTEVKIPVNSIELNNEEDKVEIKNFFGNEWNQEYELIYLSYVLEK
jgi:hypothetical protein